MNPQLCIRVDHRHDLYSPDGRTVYLRVTDFGPMGYASWKSDALEHPITRLEHSSVSLGFFGIHPDKRPDFEPAREVLRQALSELGNLVMHEPNVPRVATFGGGYFKVRWTPDGYGRGTWTLAQPIDPRADFEDQEYEVTTVANLRDGIWLALERAVIMAGGRSEYANLGEVMRILALLLTSDPHLISFDQPAAAEVN